MISIHALREEGDASCGARGGAVWVFLSTPSARRATQSSRTTAAMDTFLSTPSARRATNPVRLSAASVSNFYPRPPRGGRPSSCGSRCGPGDFYPRPPRGGRPGHSSASGIEQLISIHALREEGDQHGRQHDLQPLKNFYPRPPRGGRLLRFPAPPTSVSKSFLSTPSARRATKVSCTRSEHTPENLISIHALREEGDSTGTSSIGPS